MLLVRAIERGLTLHDFNEMTIGMVLDYIITYNNLNAHGTNEEEQIREATQEDFDKF
ncbi:MAG: Asp-tRNA(Asn)/Glu-tRNA(Gln) amidotransferase GatCAB subunit C [Oscillospiraceae bacterium]|jgi:hypothetical protein